MDVKKNKDIDSLTIYAKKTKSKEIIKNYKTFGWHLKSESENNQYEDISDLTFYREHKIKNKDELQLLQVYMEDKLNEIGKIEKYKNSKSTAFGLFFGIISLALIIFGTLFGFKIIVGASIASSIIMSCIGIIFLILTLIFVPILSKKERACFNSRHTQLENELQEIINKATFLSGGSDSEKNNN